MLAEGWGHGTEGEEEEKNSQHNNSTTTKLDDRHTHTNTYEYTRQLTNTDQVGNIAGCSFLNTHHY